MKNFLLMFLTALLLLSCEMDKKTEIVVIANNEKSSLLVVKQPDQNITDSLVFYDKVDGAVFSSGEIRTVSLPYIGVRSLPDNEKLYLYFFNLDSVDKFRGENKVHGIIKKSLVKKVIIRLNKVEENLDTIYLSKIRLKNGSNK